MTDRWHGCLVSVDCGSVLGIFEGKVSGVNVKNQTISLINATRNGTVCPVSEVTLSARDICDLKILQGRTETEKSNEVHHIIHHSGDSAFEQPSSGNSCHGRISPGKEDNFKKKAGEAKKKSTPKKADGKKWLNEKDEACFSAPVDKFILENEFDFEKNLALFDKQALFDELNSLCKPDAVRLVDSNRRVQPKYRCDENILVSETPVMRQITVPHEVEKEYVTDTGLVVPSITQEFRESLLKHADDCGLTTERRLEMIGRAASEMVLQLLGGSHRLNPQNTHQRPTVVILCGLHTQGAQGASCGRHLANHGVNVTLLSPPNSQQSELWFGKELKLFNLSGGKTTSDVSSMPSTVDIILGALDAHDKSISDHNWYSAATQWAIQCKAPVLCVDPPPEGSALEPKWVLVPVLPFALKENSYSLYLCDLGFPKEVFAKAGSKYMSPFGSKFIIPLYTKSV